MQGDHILLTPGAVLTVQYVPLSDDEQDRQADVDHDAQPSFSDPAFELDSPTCEPDIDRAASPSHTISRDRSRSPNR